MKHLRRMMVAAASVAVVLGNVGAATPAPDNAQGRWVIRDLSPFRASAINERGQIVGSAETTTGETHAFLWESGKMTDLGTLPGFRSSGAVDINERGQIVGEGTNYRPDGSTVSYHAFLWEDGRMRDLGTLGGRTSYPGDINDRGQVVGGAKTEKGKSHAFLWQNGKMRDLGMAGELLSINNRGQITGTDWDLSRAFFWQNGTKRELTLGGSSFAEAINEAGQVAGLSVTKKGDGTHAFLWQNGRMRDLGTLPGRRESSAEAINERGQVVGDSENCRWESGDVVCTATRAFLWQDGKMRNLGRLPVAAGTPNPESKALAINERRQVVGTSTWTYDKPPGTAYNDRAFVWQEGKMTALPGLPGAWDFNVIAINDRGQIIGDLKIGEVWRSVLWTFTP